MDEVKIVQTMATIANLGAATAVIVVVVLFLRYNEKRDSEWRTFFVDLNKNYVEDLRGITSSLQQLVATIKGMLDCNSADKTEYLNSLARVMDEIKVHDGRVARRVKSLHGSISANSPRRVKSVNFKDEDTELTSEDEDE